MDTITILLVVVSLLDLGLAVVLYQRAVPTKANKTFGVLLFLVFLWCVTMIFYRLAGPESVLFWAKLLHIAAALVPPTFLYFSLFFPKDEGASRVGQTLIVGLTLGVMILILDPRLLVAGAQPGIGRSEPVYFLGPHYWIYILHIVGSYTIAFVILIVKMMKSGGVEKMQLRYLLLGSGLTGWPAFVTNLWMPYVGDFSLNWLGQVFTLFLVASISFSIVRHRFMDIRLAVRAMIFRLLVIGILGVVFLLGAKLFTANVVEATQQNIVLMAVGAAILVGLLYNSLDRGIRALTDKVLFQGLYNRQELLRNLGKLMAESIDLTEVEEGIRKTLEQAMRVQTVKFVLTGDPEAEHFRAGSRGVGLLMEQVKASPEMIVYDELTRALGQMEGGAQKSRLEAVRSQMRQENVGVVLPLTATGGVIGMVLLGEKAGGDAFTSTDLDALEALSYQAGVAIENAALFEETKEFNIRLQREVKKATYDLEQRNRRLSVLRRLDQIILNTLEINEMAQKIVDLVGWEMGFHGALMGLLEEADPSAGSGRGGKRYLKPVALSSTPVLDKVIKALPKPLQEYRLAIDLDPSNLLSQSLKERRPIGTDSFRDLYVPPLDYKVAGIIEKLLGFRHHVVYPLSAKGKPLGVVVFGLPKDYSQLTRDENELIESFMDEAGIAIENAQLYAQLKETNEQLRLANIRLRELDQMKDELVSIASHELRTPMTAIKSYLWMALNKGGDKMSAKLTKYIERALESSDRMINLVNDMLSVSRLEGRRMKLELQPTEIWQVIDEVVVDLKPKIDEKNLRLKLEGSEGKMPKVKIDPERVQEVLFNIVGNAVKFTEKGKITIRVGLEGRKSPDSPDNGERGRKYVWVAVQDTGAGIDEEDMPRLFKKFGRLEAGDFAKAAESQGGTGLGLYISKGIVELHGGEIWVESKVGEGSTFTFSVPVIE